MKATGKVRKIDDLGRIVIPSDIRVSHDINTNQEFEIYRDGNLIVVEKYQETCIFCDGVDALVKFNDRSICLSCIASIAQKMGLVENAG